MSLRVYWSKWLQYDFQSSGMPKNVRNLFLTVRVSRFTLIITHWNSSSNKIETKKTIFKRLFDACNCPTKALFLKKSQIVTFVVIFDSPHMSVKSTSCRSADNRQNFSNFYRSCDRSSRIVLSRSWRDFRHLWPNDLGQRMCVVGLLLQSELRRLALVLS